MIKIMYVEDDLDTLNVVKLILEKRGYKVIGALNGKQALEKLKKAKVDLILLDIMLPDLSGWDLFQRIRSTDKKIKMAFLSAIPVSDERRKSLRKSGISDYIMKPFTKESLIQRIESIVSKK
ncbi:response regulator [Candidatus Woesearchaeota archaeon]|nr:response regulator [Candidatus Woesearchaeota archaeon]